MTPVFPYLIRRSKDGWRGELLMRVRSGKSAYVVHLSLEQSRMLAVEMRGLATDHCPLHHLAVRLAEGLDAKISHVVIRPMGSGDVVTGILRIATATGMQSVHVDAAAGLALAIHMGTPIFMDGEFSPEEPESEEESGLAEEDTASDFVTPIPPAFQDVLDGLSATNDHDGPENRPSSQEPR